MTTTDLTAAIERYAAEELAWHAAGAELLAKFTLAEIGSLLMAAHAASMIASERLGPCEAAEILDWQVDRPAIEDAAAAFRRAHEALGEPDDRAELQKLTPAMLGLRAA